MQKEIEKMFLDFKVIAIELITLGHCNRIGF